MKRIEFKASSDTLIGNLFQPDGDTRGAAVITGPLTSVKEQAPGAYAAALAKNGIATLAFDHRYFGESEGTPRQYENPDQKIADIHAAVAKLQREVPGMPVFAVGVCAGGGYMAGAVAQIPDIKAFAGIAGFYHDVAQSKEWMGDGFDAAIERGRKAREAFESSGEAETIPAVAPDGERAMPMEEAFEFYGTARGGEATYPNYKNEYAVMSQEQVTAYDAQTRAQKITVPTLLVHSENALSPMLARRLYDNLAGPKDMEWVTSKGQIGFYDDPAIIEPVAIRVSDFFVGSVNL
ncbi:MAG: alpha/beta fold hydrolase [Pseudomonadota bacterium]